jgi:hypothetical protein
MSQSNTSTEIASDGRPVVSIIIALHRWNDRSCKSVVECLKLSESTTFPIEVIVVSDQKGEEIPEGAKWYVTGAQGDTSPAFKRDVGVQHSEGTYLAFIDDDAFPESNWLNSAIAAITKMKVDAVGGPGVTPSDITWRERIGGAVYSSIFGSGPFRYRFRPQGSQKIIEEFPAYNFIVKQSALAAIGGWNSSFYGGEDTVVCTRLREKGFIIGYSPDVVVHHYRRAIFGSHLRQIGNVGRHRGNFVRNHDASSMHPIFFAPLLVPIIIFGALVLVLTMGVEHLAATIASALVLWLLLSVTSIKDAGWLSIAVPPAIVAHHLWYGGNFIRGFAESTIDTDRDTTALAGTKSVNPGE